MRKKHNKKSRRSIWMTMAVTICVLAGCGQEGAEGKEGTPVSAGGDDTGKTTAALDEQTGPGITGSHVVPFEEIIFPESQPSQPTWAEEDYWDYDDMSVHYDLEFFLHDYGVPALKQEEDPICQWLNEKFNVNITITTCGNADLEQVLSTRLSGNDFPDLFMIPSQSYGFSLGEQGLVVDARQMYPYLPQTRKFVTDTMIKWSTQESGVIPFFTRYAIQDSDTWNFFIRQDWLDNLDMDMPTTIEEYKKVAHAFTYEDPDQNGRDDTYFMIGAGGGESLGMVANFVSWFGNPSVHAQDGVLVSPMLDGTMKEFYGFVCELYQDGVFAPDWYTIDWSTGTSYTMGDRVGMLNYPINSLYQEYKAAHNEDWDSVRVWSALPSLPEGARGFAGGAPGYMWAVARSNVENDPGKLLRILHIMDSVCLGGDAYLQTIKDGGNEVFDGYNEDIRQYNDDGTWMAYQAQNHPCTTGQYGPGWEPMGIWQVLGLTTKWEVEYIPEDMEDAQKRYMEQKTADSILISSYDRWPNDALLCSVPGDIAPNLHEFEQAQEYKFVTGERSLEEWEDYVQEWLDQGGREVLKAQAEKLGVELPDIAK